MYQSFFGLTSAPFSIAPDPRYLYMSERHREALAHLLYGLDAGGGFVLLSGDIGAGKTTVCRCFLEQVPPTCQVAYIFNPKLTTTELLHSVCDEFGVEVTPAVPGAPTVKDYLDPLNRFLLDAHARGRQSVLVIDEAQNLSARVLEQLRLLTNLETRDRKLLQIVLIGQPELRRLLARPELEQLAQRIIARFHLGALSEGETAAYVAHRLAVAGCSGPSPFDRAALRLIHRRTGGVPRRINLLCDRALLGAYSQQRSAIGRRIVAQAASEVFDRGGDALWPGRPMAWAMAGLTVLALAAAGIGLARSRMASASGDPPESASASAVAGGGVPIVAAPPAAVGASFAGIPSPEGVGFDVGADFARLPRDERALWRELAAAWSVDLPAGDPCASPPSAPLACYRTGTATLELVRLLDRPGLVRLVDLQGRAVHARLVGLDGRSVRLAAGPLRWALPLAEFGALWRGEFATFWRPPPGYVGPLVAEAAGPPVQALVEGLATWRHQATPASGAVMDADLRARLAAFQLEQGLVPDGRAGPTTFIVLGRALGADGPRLGWE
jgi:general secretion pathway protein A